MNPRLPTSSVPSENSFLARVWIGSIGTAMLRYSGQRMRSSSHMQRLSPNLSTQRTGASRFAQFRFDIQWRLAPAADAARYRDMKLHSILFGWSDPDQALRVAAGIPGKRASDGLWPGGHCCQGCGAFPTMYRTW